MTVWSSSHQWRFLLTTTSFCYQLTLGFPHQHLPWCFGLFIWSYTIIFFFKYPSRSFLVVSVLQVPLGMLTSLWSLEAIFSHKPTFVIQMINLHFFLSPADTVESLQPSISFWFLWHFYVICCSFFFLHFYILLCCGSRLQILYQT